MQSPEEEAVEERKTIRPLSGRSKDSFTFINTGQTHGHLHSSRLNSHLIIYKTSGSVLHKSCLGRHHAFLYREGHFFPFSLICGVFLFWFFILHVRSWVFKNKVPPTSQALTWVPLGNQGMVMPEVGWGRAGSGWVRVCWGGGWGSGWCIMSQEAG